MEAPLPLATGSKVIRTAMYTQLCRDTVVHIVHISCVKVHDGQTDVIMHSCRAILEEEKQLICWN